MTNEELWRKAKEQAEIWGGNTKGAQFVWAHGYEYGYLACQTEEKVDYLTRAIARVLYSGTSQGQSWDHDILRAALVDMGLDEAARDG